MSQYYYAVTSLPLLFLESEYYPSMDEFLGICRENLGVGDQRVIEEAFSMLDDGYQSSEGRSAILFKDWIDWNRSLRADLAFLRAQSLGWDLEQHKSIDRAIGTEEVAREIYNQDSPLAAEEMLERYRWAMLDELEVGHYFDLRKLIVYMIRISILSRRALFTQESGVENFSRIYGTISEGKIGNNPEK